MDEVSMVARAEIRRTVRAQRRSLSAGDRRRHARSLVRHFAAHPLFLRSRHIAFYLPNDGELDLRPLMARAWSMGKRCYLPVLSPTFHNRLWFAPYTPTTPLAPNLFGIPEPDHPWRTMRPSRSLDLLLMPLVAFDQAGNRIGMGGGYYDRTLAYRIRRRQWHRPRLLGVGYAFQEWPDLPSEPWDVPLDGILTEQRLQWFAD